MVRCGSQHLQNKFQGILAHSKTSQNSQQRVECKLRSESNAIFITGKTRYTAIKAS